MGGRARTRPSRCPVIVDVLLVATLAAMFVLAVAVTIRARRDHLDAAARRDQP